MRIWVELETVQDTGNMLATYNLYRLMSKAKEDPTAIGSITLLNVLCPRMTEGHCAR